MEDSKEIKNDPQPIEETPSGSKDLTKTLPEKALNNFLQGKRHMLVQDYKFAVQSLSTACELYAQHFGELAVECGEVHYLYGKALFRLSQQNAGVLGGALNEEVTEDEQEKSSEEDSKENESEKNDSDTENGEENQDDAEEVEDEKEPSESTDSPQAVSDEASKDPAEKGNEQAPSEADATILDESNAQENKQEPEEEDLDDLEVAWNSLETAKSIFLRQGEHNPESQLKVAEILQLLAEISMESDNNPGAINDLKECLNIKRRHLKPDDRLLAETYYQMGLAQMLEKMYTEALENFTTTMNILQLRIDNLKSTPVTDTIGNFERADCEKEIEDLESVLADIKEKVEDTKELIQDAEKVLKEEISKRMKDMEQVGFPKVEKSESSTSKPVTNITHLLKRKKPEQEEDKERELKRPKLTSSVPNGDTKMTE